MNPKNQARSGGLSSANQGPWRMIMGASEFDLVVFGGSGKSAGNPIVAIVSGPV
jgi:hypothetical protein